MDSMEANQPDTNTSKQKKRGTRRQQRYRAKQKLLQLCELASAQAGNVIRTDDTARAHLVVVWFDISLNKYTACPANGQPALLK
jgi:hypothetical protein